MDMNYFTREDVIRSKALGGILNKLISSGYYELVGKMMGSEKPSEGTRGKNISAPGKAVGGTKNG